MEGRPSSASASSQIEAAQTSAPSTSQNPLSAARFEFINTTGPEQYSEADARSRARAHVMRQVHMEKDKERAARASGPASGTSSVQSGDMSLANLTSDWVGGWGLRLPSGVPTGVDDRTDAEQQFVPIVTPGASRVTAGSAVHDATKMPALRTGTTANELESIGSDPLLALSNMEQRLVVPTTVSPGGFTVDLNAVERVRHCKLCMFTNP